MTDLIHFLWIVFLIFTAACLVICVTAHLHYHNRRGIDEERDFLSRYEYFGQPILDQQGQIHSYELLLREYNSRTKRWQLPKDVANFPLSKMVTTVQKIDPAIIFSIDRLALNMTVSQLVDFRAAYFFRWICGIINQQQLTVEIDAQDIAAAGLLQRQRLARLLSQLDHSHIKVAIENVDSSRKTYLLLQRFLPATDFLKFDIQSFHKSASHWIDVTLAQWQRRAGKMGIATIVSKVEAEDQVELANQLNIELRQGYAYGHPESLSKS